MTEYFWVNFHRIMIFVRFNVYDINNIEIVNCLIETLYYNYSNDEMCNILIQIQPSLDKWLMNGDSKYENSFSRFSEFIISALLLLKKSLVKSEYGMAFDICDMLQGLPEYDYCYDVLNLKTYWNIYVKMFNRKWKTKIFNQYKYIFTKKL